MLPDHSPKLMALEPELRSVADTFLHQAVPGNRPVVVHVLAQSPGRLLSMVGSQLRKLEALAFHAVAQNRLVHSRRRS